MQSPRNSFFVKGRFALISGLVVAGFLLAIVITRSTHAQGNEPPVADSGGPYSGSPQQPTQLSGSGSWDPDGWITNYSWNFGDGATGSGETPSHSYAAEGTYVVTLTVTDNSGATNSSQTTITVEAISGPQPVTINFDELPSGALVTNQYLPRVAFSATGFSAGSGGPNGFDLYADPYPPPFSSNHAIISEYNPFRGNPFYSHGIGDVFLDFALPVNNLTFNILNFRYSYNQPAAYIDVYSNRFYYGTFYEYGNFAQGTIPVTNLRTIPDITGIRIYYPNNYDQFGNFLPLYYDDFNFTPDLDVNITNTRVNGSLNGTTQNALVGADIALTASATPSSATGGSYSWVFTGPYSVTGGSASSSSVTIRSTNTGTLTAKVTYTKNGFTASRNVTINAILPTLSSFSGSITAGDVINAGSHCSNLQEPVTFSLGCHQPNGPLTGMIVSATAQIPNITYVSDNSRSGVKFKQAVSAHAKELIEGRLQCISSRTDLNNYQTGWGLDTADPFVTGYPNTTAPQYFNNLTSVSMTQFDAPASPLIFGGLITRQVDAALEDNWFEDYVFYFVGSNPAAPDFEYSLPLHLTNSGNPIDRFTWRWGGYVIFDWSQQTLFRELSSTTTSIGPLPIMGAQGPVSLSRVITQTDPAPVLCPGAPNTTNEIDDNRIFVETLYDDLLKRASDTLGQQFWLSQITGCGLDTTCIYGVRQSGPYGQRLAVAKAFFYSDEFRQKYAHGADLANPPGSPNFNPTVFNPAYVRALYIAFLLRDPIPTDQAGYQWWLNNLNSTGNYDGIMDAFITGPEYRARFGAIDPHW